MIQNASPEKFPSGILTLKKQS